jgi:hypothetical protein
MSLQSYKRPNFENFRTPNLKAMGQNYILDVAFMINHREYYKGEDGGFPQVRAVVSFVNLCMFVVHSSTKSVQTMH